ncbi:MAG TPA: sortase [Bacilli bacterium]|nr:sortase [Bacilli bacterium]HQC83529.1 sortase [Bacilli bacterium]
MLRKIFNYLLIILLLLLILIPINKDNNETIHSNIISNHEIGKELLLIDKINLSENIPDKESNTNDVKYGLSLLNESDQFPHENGIMIIASHSGNSKISYFKYLDELVIGDDIDVYYDGITYKYEINNIYEINKTGKLKINKKINETKIVLITCKKNTKDRQMVYEGVSDYFKKEY